MGRDEIDEGAEEEEEGEREAEVRREDDRRLSIPSSLFLLIHELSSSFL